MCSMSGPASILHADLDAFYASVEVRDDPSLAGRPVIVGGGVVLSATYEARACGVRKAMGGAMARRLCPHAVVVKPRFEAYLAASRAVFEVFEAFTPTVEPISIDEAFLDVGGASRLFGDPVAIARALRRRVRDEVGLPVSVGIASTKHLAKVASARAKPDGLVHVVAGHERDFLYPLPVSALWGVGPVTTARLERLGIRTVADAAALGPDALKGMVGAAMGERVHALAHNTDPRRVVTGVRRRSVGSQQALGRGSTDRDDCRAVVLAACDRVARRLRAAHRLGRTVTLRVRFGDMTAITRSDTDPRPTAATAELYRRAGVLLDGVHRDIEERGVSLLGLTVSNLADRDAVQLALCFERDTSGIDDAVDRVRARFGRDALAAGSLLRRRDLREPLGIELVERPAPPGPRPSPARPGPPRGGG